MKHSIRFLGIVLLGVAWSLSFAETSQFEEGKQYLRAPLEIADNTLLQDIAKEGNKKIQVLEFFSYGCSWCYKLDPFIEKWQESASKDVHFQRVPVEFQPAWGPLTKAYFTAVDLKALPKVHTALFEAIQTEKINNTSDNTLRDFFASKGIKQEDFDKTYNSFDVNRKQKWANAVSRAYRITAIPAVIIQGPKGVFITTLRMAGSEEALVNVLDYLMKLQQEEVVPAKKEDSKQ